MNPENPSKGYIKLYRSFRDHRYWKQKRKYSKAEAFLDLLFEAAYSEIDLQVGFQVVHLKRGQCLIRQTSLARKWGWDRGSVKRFLNLLQVQQEATIKPTNKYSILTLCNYEDYQDWRPTNEPTRDQQENIKRPSRSPEDTPGKGAKAPLRSKRNRRTKEGGGTSSLSIPNSDGLEVQATHTQNFDKLSDIEQQCWETLTMIKGFPQPTNGRIELFKEYMLDFPMVDPLEVCKALKSWYADNPITKGAKPMSRLRNFFKSEADWVAEHRQKGEDDKCKRCGGKGYWERGGVEGISTPIRQDCEECHGTGEVRRYR
jgi:hypothetical protein